MVKNTPMAPPDTLKDSVTIAPAVLVTTVRMAALSIEGIRKTTSPPTIERWFRRFTSDDGISVEVVDGAVQVEIHLVVDGLRSLKTLSRRVQEEVTRTINEYVGMPVSAVNVHIEDIDFSDD
jgi:uncharacterized alkaline shock family protein YloU